MTTFCCGDLTCRNVPTLVVGTIVGGQPKELGYCKQHAAAIARLRNVRYVRQTKDSA